MRPFFTEHAPKLAEQFDWIPFLGALTEKRQNRVVDFDIIGAHRIANLKQEKTFQMIRSLPYVQLTTITTLTMRKVTTKTTTTITTTTTTETTTGTQGEQQQGRIHGNTVADG